MWAFLRLSISHILENKSPVSFMCFGTHLIIILYVHKRELTTCCSTPVLSFT
nr:MAG TPA: hypothetical protein [Caudoviricetes sp.]DAV73240.1 MAG TPA: hypothetical protein [Caudoviricetes sp.]DAW41607.1 MAG TPA: hypothetical protein [Caudoviricetes sp.]DAW89747.1 MAG TPA: hypothetical protein [Caudoviricetes sp.]DAY84135.1 MAG TPA: hypothetical protein [Caudoviricetes sp.]